MKRRAVGVDVSARRGLDIVVMFDDGSVCEVRQRCDVVHLTSVLKRWRPQVVCIDSPPGPGIDPDRRTRPCEQGLRALGINIFSTPGDLAQYEAPFYDWVREGEKAFEAAMSAGFQRQVDKSGVERRVLEVYPHASDVFLRGCLPPAGVTGRVRSKRAWRLDTLREAGVDPATLRLSPRRQPTMDSVDAALAALTGLRALKGDYAAYGVEREWIVVPSSTAGRFQRCS